MKILFAGDFLLNSKITLSNDVESLFEKCDFKICNFEAPLKKEKYKPIIKAGTAISQGINSCNFLKKYNFNFVSIANNHILDYGKEGLLYTIDQLKNNGIGVWGAGLTYDDAYTPLIIGSDFKIGIITGCQSEFGVLKNPMDKYGYAAITSNKTREQIIKLRQVVDYLIVFPHAGLEDVSFPLPEWRECYRSFIDCGADIVIASHPHIIQGIEKYNSKSIYYSLGNFIFDLPTVNNVQEKKKGLFVVVDVENNSFKLDHYPFFIKDDILKLDFSLDTIDAIKSRSNILINNYLYNQSLDNIVDEYWHKIYKFYYLNKYSIGLKGEFFNFWKSIINKLLGVKVNKEGELKIDETLLLHNIQIETHRWIVERYLHNKNREINKLL